MVMINLGSISTGTVQPESAYGILRSSNLPLDALCLAIQGLAIGALFGNPILGATAGFIISMTDRIFTPLINQCLPGSSYNVMGLPLGLKNIVLAGASMLTAIKVAGLILAII
jgi:hypothetical protein